MKLLGVVDWVNQDKGIAGLDPLVEIIDGQDPRPVEPDEFPQDGQVFWLNAREALKGRLFYFRAEGNPGFKDEYRVAEPSPAMEVLDVRDLGAPDKVRDALAAGVRRRGFIPERALLQCAPSELIGPVRLSTDRPGVLSLAEPKRHEIACYAAASVNVLEIEVGAVTRLILLDELGPPQSYVDWDEDRLVVRRAITFAVERAKRQGAPLALTTKLVTEAAEGLTHPGGDARVRLEEYRLRHSVEVFRRSSAVDDLASTIVDVLVSHPSLAPELERVRQQVREETRAQVEAELTTTRAGVDAAKAERKALETSVATQRQELERLRNQLQGELATVEAELGRQVKQALANPAALLAQASLFRAVAGGGGTSVHAPATRPRPTTKWPRSGVVIDDVAAFRRALMPAYQRCGLTPVLGTKIQAALAAGLFPLLAGPDSLNALDAFAHVACAGRCFQVTVTPGMIDVVDLFGRVQDGRFVPHAAGLIDVIQTARSEGHLALVVIDGVNRGATESFLLPLLQASRRGQPVHLFHPSSISEHDPYASESVVAWPANVLLAGTVVEGPTSLPVSRDVLASSATLETDAHIGTLAPLSPALSEVAAQADFMRPAKAPAGLIDDVVSAFPEYVGLRPSMEAFAGTWSRFVSEPKQLIEAVVGSVLLPTCSLVEDDERRTELAEQAAGAMAADADAARATMTRLSRRLG